MDVGGYSLIELLVVIAIMGTVLGAVTTIFVSGTKAEATANQRFQAQTQAGLALARLRGDVHCASAIAPSGASSLIALTLPSFCPGGGGTVSWCAVGSGSRYGLYRQTGSTCSSGGPLVADYLVSPYVFVYTAPVSGTSLGSLAVDLRVNVQPTAVSSQYELADTLVLRNTAR